MQLARLMDIGWNFAAALSGMNTVHKNYFEWKVSQSKKEIKNDWLGMKGNDLWKSRVMLGWEKANNSPIDEDIINKVFSEWLQYNSG